MKIIRQMTLFKRTIMWLVIITITTLLAVVTIGIEIRNTIQHHGLTRIERILQRKITTIDAYAKGQQNALENLKQLIFFATRHHPVFQRHFWDTNPVELTTSLKEFANRNGFYDIFFISLSGDIVNTVKHESDLHTNLLNGPYSHTKLADIFRDALRKKKPYISDYTYYQPSRDYAAFMAIPLEINHKLIGILAIQMDNKTLQSAIENTIDLGSSGEIIAFFQESNITRTIAPVRHSNIQAFAPMNGLYREITINSMNGKSGTVYIINRLHKIAAASWGYQKDFHIGIVATIDQSELLKEWYQNITTVLILLFSGTVLITMMIIFALRSFLKPIQILIKDAKKIAQGDYQVEIDTQQYDYEWQLLLRAFKNMSDEIAQKIRLLNKQNHLLLNQKEEIERLNRTFEIKLEEKSYKLQEYIAIIDQYVITSQTDIHGTITYVSDAFCKISGYTKEELIGQNHRIIRHPDMPSELFLELWLTITSGQIWHGEIKNRKSDGTYYWVDTTISANIENGNIVGYTAVRHDITNQKFIEDMAVLDPLTGLNNRRNYIDTIQNELNRSNRHGNSVALIMIDVDNFKRYNDTYGHHEGDIVLQKVAAVLKQYTSRNGEYAFRLGGEEFAIIVSQREIEEYKQLCELMRSGIESMHIRHENNDASEYVTISIGLFIATHIGELTHEDFYKAADKMLYEAKENGRNQVCLQIYPNSI